MLRTILIAGLLATSAEAQTRAPSPPHNWMTPPDRGGAAKMRVMFYTGNKLSELCSYTDLDPCTTYILGVVDGQNAAVTATSRDVAYCIPETASSGQIRDVVLKYLRDHPERRHIIAGTLIANALADAWPQCGGN